MFDELIGLTKEEAKEKLKEQNITLRVSKEDGKLRYGTADHNMSRLNVEVKEGKITKINGRG